ncbi:MAG: EamA family transporter [Planctomycetota bacterium]
MAILYLAIALLALASPLVKWLIQSGGALGVDNPGAISFCNVLFVGNLLGGIVAGVSFHPKRVAADLKQATRGTWVLLGVNVLLAVAIPMLLFTALSSTTVTNLVLIGRFESVIFAVLAACLGVSAINRGQVLGYTIIVVGIVALVLIQGMGSLQTGDYLVLGAAFLQAVAALLVKRMLRGVRPGSFVFVRNLFSAIVFFIVAIILYGAEHFAEAFYGDLWIVMLVYAIVVVVIGQSAWYYSLERCRPEQVATATLLTPFLAVAFAYLLLGEVPQVAHWIGGGVILTGMLIVYRGGKRAEGAQRAPESTLAGV